MFSHQQPGVSKEREDVAVLTCNILLVPLCFCIVVLQSDSLNFWCAWLSGHSVVAKTTSAVFNRNLALHGNLQRETCIVHDSVSLSDKAADL